MIFIYEKDNYLEDCHPHFFWTELSINSLPNFEKIGSTLALAITCLIHILVVIGHISKSMLNFVRLGIWITFRKTKEAKEGKRNNERAGIHFEELWSKPQGKIHFKVRYKMDEKW